MNRSITLILLVSAGLTLHPQATVKRIYQTATVVSVQKLDTMPSFTGGNPTDAPARAEEYAYAVGLRLECTDYVGRYVSAIDFLPSAIAPNKQVDVRLDKHWMYVSLESDRELKMGIVRHEPIPKEGCFAKNSFFIRAATGKQFACADTERTAAARGSLTLILTPGKRKIERSPL